MYLPSLLSVAIFTAGTLADHDCSTRADWGTYAAWEAFHLAEQLEPLKLQGVLQPHQDPLGRDLWTFEDPGSSVKVRYLPLMPQVLACHSTLTMCSYVLQVCVGNKGTFTHGFTTDDVAARIIKWIVPCCSSTDAIW